MCSNPYDRCIHFDADFKLMLDPKNRHFTYSANENVNEGYCINVILINTDIQKKVVKSNSISNKADNITIPVCNPNTGERILTKLNKSHNFKIDCICKHPDIITQKIPLESDCDVPVACSGGTLIGPDWRNNKILVDIVEDLQCDNCPPDSFPDRNAETNYPICRHRTFAESTIDDVEMRPRLYPEGIPLLSLSHPAIEPDFVKKFDKPHSRKVPNPCGFDILTNKIFYQNECELAHTPDKSIYFCKSNDVGVLTVQISDDYLRGNSGQWANGCFRYTDDEIHTSYAVAEYYNTRPFKEDQTPHPIIGYAIDDHKVANTAITWAGAVE